MGRSDRSSNLRCPIFSSPTGMFYVVRHPVMAGVDNRKPEVLIVTDDMLFGQQVRESLIELGVKPYALPFDKTPPPSVRVVITTRGERGKIRFDPQNVVSSTNPKTTARAALELLENPPAVLPLRLGIDPGPRPGMAVLLNGEVVATFQVPPGETKALVKRLVGKRGRDECLVRIGDGSPPKGNRITNSLLNEGIRCEVVDESGTTPTPGEGGLHHSQRDIAAAIAIAQKTGVPARIEELEPTEGRVKWVQAESRRLSGGRATIPHELARKVARGELTIEEAVQSLDVPAEQGDVAGEQDGGGNSNSNGSS